MLENAIREKHLDGLVEDALDLLGYDLANEVAISARIFLSGKHCKFFDDFAESDFCTVKEVNKYMIAKSVMAYMYPPSTNYWESWDKVLANRSEIYNKERIK